MEKINLAGKFSLFNDYWNPRIIGELNDNYVKLVKLKDDFIWHHHDTEDELFFVVKGKLLMDFKDDTAPGKAKTIEIGPGEMIVVPKGVEHRPHAAEEVHLMLIEPKSTLNTGNEENEMTRKELQHI